MSRLHRFAIRAVDVTACGAFGALVALLPWEVIQRLPSGGMTAIKIASAVFVVAAAAQTVLAGRERVRLRTGIEWPLAVFLVAAAASTFVSQNHAASMFYLRVMATYAVLFVAAVAHVRTAETAAAYVRVFCLSAALGALVTLAAALGWLAPTHWRPAAFPWSMRLIDEARAGATMRLTATGMDINLGAFGCLLAFVVAITLRPFRGVRHGVALQGALLAVLAAGMIVPQSRSALLTAGLIVAFFGLRKVARASKAAFFALFVLSVAAVAVAVWFGSDVLLGRGDDSISSRITGYRAGLDLLKRYAALGTGLGASDALLGTTELGKKLDGATIHNLPLKLWLEMGALGIAAYLVFWPIAFGGAMAHAWGAMSEAQRRHGRVAVAVLAAAFAMSLVQPFIITPYYPVLLGLLFGPIAQATQRFNAPDTAAWDVRRLWERAPALRRGAAVAVLAFVAWQLVAYNVAAKKALAASDALYAGVLAEEVGRWNDARNAYEDAAARLADGSPWDDVFALVYDVPYTFRAMSLQHRAPAPVAAARYGAGRAAWSAGQPEAAERQLRAALDIQPNLVEARFVLAELLWASKKYPRAYAEIRRVRTDERHWESVKFYGRMREYDRRIAILEGRKTPSADDTVELCLLLRLRGRWEDACALAQTLAASGESVVAPDLLAQLRDAVRAISSENATSPSAPQTQCCLE